MFFFLLGGGGGGHELRVIKYSYYFGVLTTFVNAGTRVGSFSLVLRVMRVV